MTRGGSLDLGGEPYVRVFVTDDDGDCVFVTTSVYEHTTEAERQAMAEANHLYPGRHDYEMSDFPMDALSG